MKLEIRQETTSEFETVEEVVEKAFANAEFTDHSEHILVKRLRKSQSYIPELSLVAVVNGRLVGHVLLTKIKIASESRGEDSLALAPVSVLPEYQNRGVGSALINEGIRIAKELGYKSVIVLGHENYYPKFGFKPAGNWNIKAPFDVPNEVFQALELESGALAGVSGTVEYAREFFE